MNRKTINLTALALLTVVASGCSLFGNFAKGLGVDTRDLSKSLDKYEIETMTLKLQGEKTRICPGIGAGVEVGVVAHKKKKPDKKESLRTPRAGDSDRDKFKSIDFTEFVYESPLGKVDENGVFVTESDPFASLEGFPMTVSYRADKSKTASETFLPRYDCWTTVGPMGDGGATGMGGLDGDAGGAGGAGGPGGDGGSGGQVAAYVSIVSTPVYDRVGIVQLQGDSSGTFLFDLDAGLVVSARGGSGGSGGSGGFGGNGDASQAGGSGGAGGDGGNGGDGGVVAVVLDARFPELKSVVSADVSGGGPGYEGPGGDGGVGGEYGDSGDYAPDGPAGPPGRPGGYGGRDGRSDVQLGNVTSIFASLPAGVELL